MKLNKQEQDGEELPIMTSDNFDIKNSKKFFHQINLFIQIKLY